MTAPTPLVATMQALAREPWKENTFPVIHNGRLVEWNPYYYDEGELYLKIFQAKGEGLPREDLDVVWKKVDEYRIKKISGRFFVHRASADNTYTCRMMLANGESFDLQDKYVKALCQDSPVFDKLFAGRPEQVQVEGVTKSDMELLIAYAYGERPRGGRPAMKAAELAMRFKMHDVLIKAQSVLYLGIEALDDHFSSLDWACNAYRCFQGPRDGSARELMHDYFSTVVSKCNPEQFKTAVQQLNGINLSCFKLWPQEDGRDSKRARILVNELKSLESLDLSCVSDLDPRALDNIGGMNKLEWLFLNGCHRIDDMALEKISAVKTLDNLVMSGKLITDQGLAHLGSLSNLRQLLIWGPSEITDKGIQVCDRLEKLEYLRVPDCKKLSEAALKALKVSHVSNRFMT